MSTPQQATEPWTSSTQNDVWASHTKVQWVVSHLAANPIEDVVLEGPNLDFEFVANKAGKSCLTIRFIHNQAVHLRSVHWHAFKQLCGRVSLPPSYAASLQREDAAWAQDLLTVNLRELYTARGDDKSYLLRSVNGELRGFLTNAYKRLNTEKLIEVFAQSCSKHGAKPYDGIYSPVRVGVQAATEDSFKVANRSVRVGVMLRNSDFGAGALEVQFFLSPALGLAMVGRRGIRRIHKGKRLSKNMEDNENLEVKDIGMASKSIEELVEVHLDHNSIVAAMAEVQLAADTEVDPDKVSDMLETLHLSKDEAEQAKEVFLQSNDPRIPSGTTMFRLASTIAWLGSTCGDPEKQLDLQELAGSLILKGR